MLEQAFRTIDADLRNEAGCTTELNPVEQMSWPLFLKSLDDLERDKADEVAELAEPAKTRAAFVVFQKHLYEGT